MTKVGMGLFMLNITKIGRTALSMAASAIVAMASSNANASSCDDIHLCVDWVQVPLQDAGYGDYMNGGVYHARGARVNIIRPYPEPAFGAHLDDEGCITYESQFKAGHKLVVFAEAVVGLGTNGAIHVESYASRADYEAGTESAWVIDLPSVPDSMELEANVHADEGHQVMLLSTAVETLHRLHGLPGSLLVGNHGLQLYVDMDRLNAAAGPGGAIQALRFGRDTLQKKFIVGHEIGHWIQLQLAGYWTGPGVNPYLYGPAPPAPGEQPDYPEASGEPYDEDCRFAAVGVDPEDQTTWSPASHGIRSAEWTTGAMPEGFGHFVAAAAFNDLETDGVFKYYKDIDTSVDGTPAYATFEANEGQVSLAGGLGASTLGGTSRWVEQMCEDDWDYPLEPSTLGEEVSSEIDWLRLFWQFVTAAPTAGAPTFWETVHFVTYTQENYAWSEDDHVLWPLMESAATDNGYATRFESLSLLGASGNGVYNDPP